MNTENKTINHKGYQFIGISGKGYLDIRASGIISITHYLNFQFFSLRLICLRHNNNPIFKQFSIFNN
jgi:hypothetical protein